MFQQVQPKERRPKSSQTGGTSFKRIFIGHPVGSNLVQQLRNVESHQDSSSVELRMNVSTPTVRNRGEAKRDLQEMQVESTDEGPVVVNVQPNPLIEPAAEYSAFDKRFQ